MLSDNYFAKVMTAERKSSGQHYRYRVVKELIENYDNTHLNYNVIEKSRILFDAARLLGIHQYKAKNDWKFTSIDTINLDQEFIDHSDPDIRKLLADTSIKIKLFKRDLFSHFDEFKSFWNKQDFDTTDKYLDYFYHYIPYVKLGINNELDVKPFVSVEDNLLALALAQQYAVIRRINEVFLHNSPTGLPETIIDSLVDFAIRTVEENIPLDT